jgi:hypothetical protein
MPRFKCDLWGRGWGSRTQLCSCWNVGQCTCTHVPQNTPDSSAKRCRDTIQCETACNVGRSGDVAQTICYITSLMVAGRWLYVALLFPTIRQRTQVSHTRDHCHSSLPFHQATKPQFQLHGMSTTTLATSWPSQQRHVNLYMSSSACFNSQHQCVSSALSGAHFMQASFARGCIIDAPAGCNLIPRSNQWLRTAATLVRRRAFLTQDQVAYHQANHTVAPVDSWHSLVWHRARRCSLQSFSPCALEAKQTAVLHLRIDLAIAA